MINRSDLEHRIRRIAWPVPTDALRARVLSSVPAAARRLSWSDRMWFSRTWRLSAAALLVALVGLESWSSAPGPVRVPPTPAALAQVDALDEAGRDLGMPPGVVSALTQRALATSARADEGRHQERLALLLIDLEGARR